ncbi:unnamed protein product [Pedinophyceae sp. YPF-701]|nr:unnamed protein product [Pedinophyceae sp. YPF-701]
MQSHVGLARGLRRKDASTPRAQAAARLPRSAPHGGARHPGVSTLGRLQTEDAVAARASTSPSADMPSVFQGAVRTGGSLLESLVRERATEKAAPSPTWRAPRGAQTPRARTSSPPIFLVAGCIALGVCNRVLHRMTLVPMGDHVIFLGQVATTSYVATYLVLLALRKRAGRVTQGMLQYPRLSMYAVGVLEASGLLLGLTGASKLPGIFLPLIAQTIMVWQVLLGRFMLRQRLRVLQLAAVALVITGVGIATTPGAGSGAILADVNPAGIAILCLGMLPLSVSSVLKERLFRDSERALGQPIDCILVNYHGAIAQACTVLCALPFFLAQTGAQFGSYLHAGSACLAGVATGAVEAGAACVGAPFVTAFYVTVNICFNLVLLMTVRRLGALRSSLCMAVVVPVSLLAFTLNLPLLGPSPELGARFWCGASVLVAGVVAYNWPTEDAAKEAAPASTAAPAIPGPVEPRPFDSVDAHVPLGLAAAAAERQG